MNTEKEFIQLIEDYKFLQAKVLSFRNKICLNGGITDFTILKKFDEHFGIIFYHGGKIIENEEA